jgi:protein tyrosine phosphatase (PTP) superfamily phosphohydrolase (DUF442 family)
MTMQPDHKGARRKVPGSRRWWLWLAASLAVCAAILFGVPQGRRLWTHNLNEVDPGRLYRSAQLGPADLEAVIRRLGIQTVVNLRGAAPTRAWCQDERGVCVKLGVKHLDIPWDARQLPAPESVHALLEAYVEGPYPMLIHCKAGADRTGLAAALYLIDRKGQAESVIHRPSLSLGRGHVTLSPAWAMDEFLFLFSRSGKSLSDWLRDGYPHVYLAESNEGRWERVIEVFYPDK